MYLQNGAGQYEEAVKQGLVFSASNQAATTYTLFGNTTATGLILSNPASSTKLLSVVAIGFMKVAAAGAQIDNLVISAGANTLVSAHTTPLTVQPNNIGLVPTIGVGLVDAAATLAAAGLIIAPFTATSVSATATTSVPPPALVNMNGLFSVKPGSFIQLAAGFTNTVSGVGSIAWREIDI